MSLAYSCPHSSPHAHSLAAVCITPNPNLTPSCIGFSSYTIPVAMYLLATSYSFVRTLLLLVLCCIIPLCFVFSPSLFPFTLHSSSVSLHLSLPSPITHLLHSTLSTTLYPFPSSSFPFPFSLSVSHSTFPLPQSLIFSTIHFSHLDSTVTSSVLQPSGL